MTYEELEAQAAVYREALGTLVEDLHGLFGSSQGVAGLHRNGDIAYWIELCEGGRFEEWLGSLSKAEQALSSTTGRNLLDRLQRLEKAFELACNALAEESEGCCPGDLFGDKTFNEICHKHPDETCHRNEVVCFKEYFLHKAGEMP